MTIAEIIALIAAVEPALASLLATILQAIEAGGGTPTPAQATMLSDVMSVRNSHHTMVGGYVNGLLGNVAVKDKEA